MVRRAAFTLIELLIVISVIAILAGMILGALNYIRESVKVTKTRAIMHAAVLGISTTAMRTNVNIAPVEHPLANSRAYAGGPERSLFVRGEAGAGYAKGDAVATAGEALLVADPATLAPAEIGRLLTGSDRYCGLTAPADTDNPMLFGMQRRYLSVIGTGFGVHLVRRLPAVSPRFDRSPTDGILDSPYDDAHYPGSLDSGGGDLFAAVGSTTSFEIEQKKLFDYAFGPEVMTELTGLNGIISADDSGSDKMSTMLICSRRLRGLSYPTQPSWDPTKVPGRSAPLVKDTDGNWKTYRLRGPAVYDAWKHELLCYLASNGALIFESAGRDGLFRWDPGSDKIFQTGAADDAAAGDDLDASKDNQLTGQR